MLVCRVTRVKKTLHEIHQESDDKPFCEIWPGWHRWQMKVMELDQHYPSQSSGLAQHDPSLGSKARPRL
jgi:hypothetical protein